MFNQALNILLAASIFACPLVCRGGGRCCDNEQSTLKHACCEGCDGGPADHDRNQSGERDSESNDCCQCICGGAVIEFSDFQLQLDQYEWTTPLAPSMTAQILAAIVSPQLDFVCTPPLADNDMNTGRAIRCRIMSFLC